MLNYSVFIYVMCLKSETEKGNFPNEINNDLGFGIGIAVYSKLNTN